MSSKTSTKKNRVYHWLRQCRIQYLTFYNSDLNCYSTRSSSPFLAKIDTGMPLMKLNSPFITFRMLPNMSFSSPNLFQLHYLLDMKCTSPYTEKIVELEHVWETERHVHKTSRHLVVAPQDEGSSNCSYYSTESRQQRNIKYIHSKLLLN